MLLIMKRTKIVSECGMLAALSIIVLLLGALFEPLDLTMAFLAGFAVLAVRLRWGRKSSLMLYSATSVLAFLVLHNKLPVVLYIFYGGLFPIVKVDSERIPSKALQWLVKISFACVAYTALIFVSKQLLGIKGMDFTYSIPAYLGVVIVTLCVDFAVGLIIQQFGHILFRKRR